MYLGDGKVKWVSERWREAHAKVTARFGIRVAMSIEWFVIILFILQVDELEYISANLSQTASIKFTV